MQLYYKKFPHPLYSFFLYWTGDKKIKYIFWGKRIKEKPSSPANYCQNTSKSIKQSANKIAQALLGKKVLFSFANLELTPLSFFAKQVLKKVFAIPFGATLTYGQLAKHLQTSPRAIARIMAINPLPIIIPCHRVVGKNNPGGYGPGIKLKKILLQKEKAL